jgi:hypothetical protein
MHMLMYTCIHVNMNMSMKMKTNMNIQMHIKMHAHVNILRTVPVHVHDVDHFILGGLITINVFNVAHFMGPATRSKLFVKFLQRTVKRSELIFIF